MLKSLVIYPSYFDMHSSVLDDFEEKLIEVTLTHYASRLLENGLHDEMELEHALQKSITALNAARVPAGNHFRKVFIVSRGGNQNRLAGI